MTDRKNNYFCASCEKSIFSVKSIARGLCYVCDVGDHITHDCMKNPPEFYIGSTKKVVKKWV